MKGQRNALAKHLLHNLFTNEKIYTTEAKAKELKPKAERVITVAKKQDVVALRRLLRLFPKKTAMKVYHDIAPRYKDRKGGYLRITKSSARRQGDGSLMAMVQLV